MTDEELRSRLLASEEEGYHALNEACFRYIYAIIYHILRDCAAREDIEECTADVLLEILRQYDASHEGSVRAFAGTVAKRRAIDLRRRLFTQNKHLVQEDDTLHPDIPSPACMEEELETAERNRLLLDTILALGEPDASIILQKYFYDRSAGEIARATGLSAAAVRMRCSRALRRLRTTLTEKGITI